MLTLSQGFEAIKQLLGQAQPYRVILGARNTKGTQAAYDALTYDRAANPVTVLPLELNDLRTVRSFAKEVLAKLGADPIDYLLLNAAINSSAEAPGPHGSKWCESYVVDHLCRFITLALRHVNYDSPADMYHYTAQHYLTHLLRDKLASSKSRIVVVSSGAIRNVPDPGMSFNVALGMTGFLQNTIAAMDNDLQGGSGVSGATIYCQAKFAQFLGAHWWRRQLHGQCEVMAVSPGLIPNTGLLGSHAPQIPAAAMADAKSVPEGKFCSSFACGGRADLL
jgi:NAD(P)-dependent dehydrogenase (short-subunit alcohol dehydrogenase family)